MGTRDVESEGPLDDPDTAPNDSDDGLDDGTFEDSDDEDVPPADEADEDAAADEDDEDDEPAASPRRRNAGVWLLGLGAGTWALVAALRCSSTPAGPPLAVGPEEAEVAEAPAEPATVEPDVAPPKPVIENSEPTPTPTPEATPRFVDPHGEPATWARNLEPPSIVQYTVRRGGSLENVANLFKIYHHRIEELNPGISLDSALPPDTKVTVYKASSDASESVGLPSRGSLEGAVPMIEGPGRRLKAIPWKSWATGRTVALLDAVLRQWAKRGSDQPILVGNMSSPNGGRLPPHSTHQSGRDVDLGYVQKMRAGEEHNWREMSASNLDAGETWELLRLLAQTGKVEVIYIDRSIQKLLHEYAVKRELMTPRELSRWMEYPRPTGAGNPLIQHVAGHVDHLHVRFTCAEHEKRCRSRESS